MQTMKLPLLSMLSFSKQGECSPTMSALTIVVVLYCISSSSKCSAVRCITVVTLDGAREKWIWELT